MTPSTTHSYDPRPFRAVFERQYTMAQAFRRNVDRFADRPALGDPATGRRLTYRELGKEVDQLAAGLAAHGVGAGDVVTFQLCNTREFALVYPAAHRIGAIASPINVRFAPGETAHVLDDSHPAAYVVDASLDALAALEMAM